jgi:hypothetical protein
MASPTSCARSCLPPLRLVASAASAAVPASVSLVVTVSSLNLTDMATARYHCGNVYVSRGSTAVANWCLGILFRASARRVERWRSDEGIGLLVVVVRLFRGSTLTSSSAGVGQGMRWAKLGWLVLFTTTLYYRIDINQASSIVQSSAMFVFRAPAVKL